MGVNQQSSTSLQALLEEFSHAGAINSISSVADLHRPSCYPAIPSAPLFDPGWSCAAKQCSMQRSWRSVEISSLKLAESNGWRGIPTSKWFVHPFVHPTSTRTADFFVMMRTASPKFQREKRSVAGRLDNMLFNVHSVLSMGKPRDCRCRSSVM